MLLRRVQFDKDRLYINQLLVFLVSELELLRILYRFTILAKLLLSNPDPI